MKSLTLGTKNPDKFREIEAILAAVPVILEPLPADTEEVDETGATLEANADLKARGYALATGCFCVADDTGLEVDALGGEPGVYSARYAGPEATYADNRAKLLEALRAVPAGRRQARFRCVVSLANPAGEILARGEGVLEGVILEKARGDGGFGYDPIFAVDGKTLAEISEAEKNALSHRAAALVALRPRILELL
ncbi:MAG: RdgB/HAM1 family non-canonical purine NTP pyrophosphatase [Planctomycetota bacterium]